MCWVCVQVTHHLDVQALVGVLHGGEGAQEGEHDGGGAAPAADQEAHAHLTLVRRATQLRVDVRPVAEGQERTGVKG